MLRVYVQNLGAAGSHPNAGDRVRLEWLPEHTFVVERPRDRAGGAVNERQASAVRESSVDAGDDPAPDLPARAHPIRGEREPARSGCRRSSRPVAWAAREQATGPTAGGEGSADWWAQQQAGDHINFTNWPAYIDRDFSIDGPGSRPSLNEFIQETGIDVTYRADINSNEEFYAADPSGSGERAGYGPRHHRDHQRTGTHRDDPARVPDRARPVAPAELRRERRRRLQGPGLRPGEQVHDGVAVGDDGHRLQHEVRGRGDHHARADAEPEVRGSCGDVQQHRRCAEPSRWSSSASTPRRRRRRIGSKRRTFSRGSTTPGSFAAGSTRRT